MTTPPEQVRVLAERYTAAWCSRDASRVADYYASNGSLSINDDAPAAGRSTITEAAQGFMTAFPDMKVLMDGLLVYGDRAVYQWTLAAKYSRSWIDPPPASRPWRSRVPRATT